MAKFDSESIKNYHEEVVFRPSDGLRPYKELYLTIKRNVLYINKFESEIELIRSEYAKEFKKNAT